jgi:hypothetical protein
MACRPAGEPELFGWALNKEYTKRRGMEVGGTLQGDLPASFCCSEYLLQLSSRGRIEPQGAEADAADPFHTAERGADSQGL